MVPGGKAEQQPQPPGQGRQHMDRKLEHQHNSSPPRPAGAAFGAYPPEYLYYTRSEAKLQPESSKKLSAKQEWPVRFEGPGQGVAAFQPAGAGPDAALGGVLGGHV